jgi:hypothetical protein
MPCLFSGGLYVTAYKTKAEVTTMSGLTGTDVVAPVVAAGTTAGALTLPSTGGNFVVTLAVSVATGLVAWGVLYARSAK